MKELIKPIFKKLNSWFDTAIEMLPNFAVAIIILVAVVLLGKLFKKGVFKVLSRIYSNTELARIISKVVYFIFLIIGVMFALSVLHLDKTVSSVLAGAGVIGIALSFAFQDIAANFVSGLIMAAKKPFEIGDVIEVDGIIGSVLFIHLRTTELMTLDGNEIVIPNRKIFSNPYINYYNIKTRRIELEVGVGYGENLDEVERVTLEAIKTLSCLVADKPIDVLYTEFAESAINLKVYYWVSYETYLDYLKGKSQGIKVIKKAYYENAISIPFPIRTLDLAMKGTQSLSDNLSSEEEDKANKKKSTPETSGNENDK